MTVFEAARERIAWCFAEFDYVYVSFSGGKDSGVLLELTASVAQGRRFGIYHMDYEAQYQLTTDYVRMVTGYNYSNFTSEIINQKMTPKEKIESMLPANQAAINAANALLGFE